MLCQFAATTTGEKDRVDIPIVGPEAIDVIGDGRSQLGVDLLADFIDIEILAAIFDISGFDGFEQPMQFDADSAFFT